jgi:hypothetical protein
MMSFRKLRAILVIALTWAMLWVVGGFLLMALLALPSFLTAGRASVIGPWLLMPLAMFASIGAAMGVAFATGLAVAGRRGGWALTRARAVSLGAVGGAGCYLLFMLGLSLTFGWEFGLSLGSLATYGALGALTGIVTYGTAARGTLPTEPDAVPRLPGD